MKTGLILTSFLATGGTAGASASIGYVGGTLKTQDLNVQQSQTSELSSKNIQDISKISALKEQNKIEDLKKETIAAFVKAESSLSTSYYAPLQPNTTQEASFVQTSTNTIKLNQATLQDLLKEQIKLSKQKEVYEKIKQHFTKKAPDATEWEIVKDTVTVSGASGDVCKIQKKSSPPATLNGCHYGWQILSINLEDKIKQLLVNENSLLGEFTKHIAPTTKTI